MKMGPEGERTGTQSWNFQQQFPGALLGDLGGTAGEMWCPEGKKSRFLVKCESRTLVYLNRELILLCPGAGEYELTAKLHEGMNRLFLVSRKEAGFCCTLTNKMPQWEPCSYLMPFEERGGEAGFNFTLLRAEEADEKTAVNFFLRKSPSGKKIGEGDRKSLAAGCRRPQITLEGSGPDMVCMDRGTCCTGYGPEKGVGRADTLFEGAKRKESVYQSSYDRWMQDGCG